MFKFLNVLDNLTVLSLTVIIGQQDFISRADVFYNGTPETKMISNIFSTAKFGKCLFIF